MTQKQEHDIRGPLGYADKITDPRFESHPTGIAGYLLFAPAVHPLWSFYIAQIIHLRDVEGMPPAQKHGADMTHEIMVLALQRDFPPKKDDIKTMRWMTPANHVVQLSCDTDARAADILEQVVQQFISGVIWLDPNDVGISREQLKAFVNGLAED